MAGFGFFGLGLLRRPMVIVAVATAFWAGTEIQFAATKSRCLAEGGTVDTRGLCRGLP